MCRGIWSRGCSLKILEQGVADGVFPLARAEVLHKGRRVISAGNAPEQMQFDLASVTKVMSTTAICLELIRDGALRLDTEVVGATVEDLLYHRSGLPPFAPFF